MQIFDKFEKHFRFYGIRRPKEPPTTQSIFWNVVFLISFFGYLVSSIWFICFREKTYNEFADMFYMMNTTLINFVNFLQILWRGSSFYHLIERSTIMVEKRKTFWKIYLILYKIPRRKFVINEQF